MAHVSTIVEDHRLDADGRPAGGTTTGRGIEIRWQNGPLKVPALGSTITAGVTAYELREPSGAFVEDVIRAAIGRLELYNSTEFRCRENSLAITKLEEALHWLNHRTADRESRGVEGTHNL